MLFDTGTDETNWAMSGHTHTVDTANTQPGWSDCQALRSVPRIHRFKLANTVSDRVPFPPVTTSELRCDAPRSRSLFRVEINTA